MPRRKDYTTRIAAAWERLFANCGCPNRYYCPHSDDIECPRHSGFDTCCNHPRRHIPVTAPTPPAPPAPRSAQPTGSTAQPSEFAVPNINTNALDLDDFHPLDHDLTECVGYPGGRRRHLAYWWDFIGRPGLHARTLCRLGIHKSATIKGVDQTTPRDQPPVWLVWDGCLHCHKPLSARQPL